MSSPEALLAQGAHAILGEPLSEVQRDSFRVYLDLLVEWNRVHRLVGSSDRAWIVRNVLLDSLLFLRALPISFKSILDIGSGAGVPGIPIKIARPKTSLVMVESRRKRASFLSSAVRILGLTGVKAVHGRAESLIGAGTQFDAVVARCAGEPSAVLRLGSLLLAGGGVVVVSGAPIGQELPRTRHLRIDNPATGEERNFIVLEAAHPFPGGHG